MPESPSLSYVLTTRNKLTFLRVALQRLIDARQPDEEIVVVDGASTDGTVEYLAELQGLGVIDRFVSEPDTCQAEGTNRGLLLARGEIIKVLMDDDVYHYRGIQKCKRYLLEHGEIDVLVANIADTQYWNLGSIVAREDHEDHFVRWRDGARESFWFGDQGVFLRRRSLPLVGMYHTGVVCLDFEHSTRLTSLRQVSIGWYTGYVACAIGNPQSTTYGDGHLTRNSIDVERVNRFYSYPRSWWLDLVRRPLVLRLAAKLERRRRGSALRTDVTASADESVSSFSEAYDVCLGWLEMQDGDDPGRFLEASAPSGG